MDLDDDNEESEEEKEKEENENKIIKKIFPDEEELKVISNIPFISLYKN